MTRQEITHLFEAVDFRCSLLSNDLVGGGNDTTALPRAKQGAAPGDAIICR